MDIISRVFQPPAKLRLCITQPERCYSVITEQVHNSKLSKAASCQDTIREKKYKLDNVSYHDQAIHAELPAITILAKLLHRNF
jgi:hypothetical protein